MKFLSLTYIVIAFFLLISCRTSEDPEEVIDPTPPFFGSIFLDPDIITSNDPTTFVDLSYEGQGQRRMFDRRVNDWVTIQAFLYHVNFDDGLTAEIQINTEFETEELAQVEALKYAVVIGRLPTGLRKDVEAIRIHKGIEPFGGGNKGLLIHTGQGEIYENDGILEETFVHEAAHTSLDAMHASSPGWIASQEADGNFITTYARDNSTREDVAESFLLYLAIRYRSDRISDALKQTIMETMPNRIKYFDDQVFDLHPWE